MSNTNSFLINSSGSNPNQFIAKIGRSLSIQPGSEIALSKISLTNVVYKEITSLNNTFAILWGQNGMESTPTVNVNESKLDFMPPEIIRLTPGEYSFTSTSDEVIDTLNTPLEDKRTIVYNIISSIMKQSKYFTWGWAGKIDANQELYITTYCKNYTAGDLQLGNAMLNPGSMTYEIVPKVVGVSPAMNRITTVDNNFLSVGFSRTAFPFDTFNKPGGVADDPQTQTTFVLPIIAAPETFTRAFGGFILKSQEHYKNTESYDESKDWFGVNNSDNLMPISWEIEKGSNEVVFKIREIINGSVGNVIETWRPNGGTVYDKTQQIIIKLRGNITDFFGGVRADETRYAISISIKVGAAGEINHIFFLDSSYFGMDWLNAVCWNSSVPLLLYGTDEARMITDYSQKLGGIAGNTILTGGFHLGNVSATLIMNKIKSETLLNITPPTQTDYTFERFLLQCNCTTLQPDNGTLYNINSLNTGADLFLKINRILDKKGINICLNVDNLPIHNYTCGPDKGMTSKRIFTLMKQGTASASTRVRNLTVAIATNLNWTKLENRSEININNFQIRFSNLDGSNADSLEGNVSFVLLIRKNRELSYIDKTKATRMETIDNTENNFRLRGTF